MLIVQSNAGIEARAHWMLQDFCYIQGDLEKAPISQLHSHRRCQTCVYMHSVDISKCKQLGFNGAIHTENLRAEEKVICEL